MSRPKSEQVAYEILAVGFRSYPRSVFMGFAFASLMAAFTWPGLPHAFLVTWVAAIFALALLRLRLSSAFLQSRPPATELGRWLRQAAFAYGATGIAWGVLGAPAIYFAPPPIAYIDLTALLITVFPLMHSHI